MSPSLPGVFLITGLALLLNRFPGSKARAFVGALPFTPFTLASLDTPFANNARSRRVPHSVEQAY